MPQLMPSESMLNTVREHLENFVNNAFDHDLTNISQQIRLKTPIALYKGHGGYRKFYRILQEYLPSAELSIRSVKYYTDKVIYYWQANSPTASVENGKSVVKFKDGKIIEQRIRCEVIPQVLNQG